MRPTPDAVRTWAKRNREAHLAAHAEGGECKCPCWLLDDGTGKILTVYDWTGARIRGDALRFSIDSLDPDPED